MRLVAALTLGSAAFDAPAPFVDRLGLLALGLGLLALALPSRRQRVSDAALGTAALEQSVAAVRAARAGASLGERLAGYGSSPTITP